MKKLRRLSFLFLLAIYFAPAYSMEEQVSSSADQLCRGVESLDLASKEQVLESFDSLRGNEGDVSNLLTILRCHEQIFEFYLAERLAASSSADTPEFDDVTNSLLVREDIAVKNLSFNARALWVSFEDYLSSHDSRFSFRNFYILFEARQELACVTKEMIRFFMAIRLFLKKNKDFFMCYFNENNSKEAVKYFKKLNNLFSGPTRLIRSTGEQVERFTSLAAMMPVEDNLDRFFSDIKDAKYLDFPVIHPWSKIFDDALHYFQKLSKPIDRLVRVESIPKLVQVLNDFLNRIIDAGRKYKDLFKVMETTYRILQDNTTIIRLNA